MSFLHKSIELDQKYGPGNPPGLSVLKMIFTNAAGFPFDYRI
ncbi:MAG: hypothetical protein HPY66_2178 [Firmicutes bacterium]|nr:hypothetical protein [Bacillota bacterium]